MDSGSAFYFSLGYYCCVAELCGDRMKICIAIGAIHGGGKRCSQVHGMLARGNSKIRCLGLAAHLELFERPIEFPGRREPAPNAMENSEIRIGEAVLACNRCLTGVASVPRAEFALGPNQSWRFGIAQLRVIPHRLLDSHGIKFELVDVESERRLGARLGEYLEQRTVRNDLPHDDPRLGLTFIASAVFSVLIRTA